MAALVAAVRLDPHCWLCAAAILLYAVADTVLEYNFIFGAGVFLGGHIFNIAFALFVKAVVAILVMIPAISIPMMIPVIADTGLTVVLVLNSLLILYRKIRKQ